MNKNSCQKRLMCFAKWNIPHFSHCIILTGCTLNEPKKLSKVEKKFCQINICHSNKQHTFSGLSTIYLHFLSLSTLSRNFSGVRKLFHTLSSLTKLLHTFTGLRTNSLTLQLFFLYIKLLEAFVSNKHRLSTELKSRSPLSRYRFNTVFLWWQTHIGWRFSSNLTWRRGK